MKPKRGRPPKKKAERKDKDLRIPVTSEQKAQIIAASERAGEDFAAWARQVLLAASQS